MADIRLGGAAGFQLDANDSFLRLTATSRERRLTAAGFVAVITSVARYYDELSTAQRTAALVRDGVVNVALSIAPNSIDLPYARGTEQALAEVLAGALGAPEHTERG